MISSEPGAIATGLFGSVVQMIDSFSRSLWNGFPVGQIATSFYGVVGRLSIPQPVLTGFQFLRLKPIVRTGSGSDRVFFKDVKTPFDL